MDILTLHRKSDLLGMIASGLCLLHCLSSPFVLVLYANSLGMSPAKSIWWSSLDIIFLFISFIAIRQSSKMTSKVAVKYAFWISWLLLCILILNEKFEVYHLPEWLMYGTSLSIIGLHFYNKKYGHCNDQQCCED